MHGFSDSPTASPIGLIVYPAHGSSPPPELEGSNAQYMYSETDSIFYGDLLPYEDVYAQSPGHATPLIWETCTSTNGLGLTSSESPKSKPVLYGHHQALYYSNMIKDESTEDSAVCLSRASQSTSSSCDETGVDAQCIEFKDTLYRSHSNDEHEACRTDSPVQFEAPNPCSPGKGLRKGGNAYAGKTADEIDVEDEEIPYAQLIYKALMSVPSRTMILGEIYQYFRGNIPRFSKVRGKGWQNSIRHNLSMNGAFRKVERPLGPDGSKQRGYYWVLSREAEKEGVKSTTRFRKNSTSSRRKSGSSDASSEHKEDIPLSHRRKKTRSAAASKLSSRKAPGRTPSPAAESKITVHVCVQAKGSDSLPDMQSYGAVSNQNFDPSTHPALYTSMWDLQPVNHYYPDSYSSELTSYDENINSIFNEEFALLQRSQAFQPVLSNGYSSPLQ